MTTAPRASVVVPHFQQPTALMLCLESLAAQSFPRAGFEVVVADNGSSDQAALQKALSAFPAARLVREVKRGAAHARNAAMAVAQGEIIAFIDADCIAHSRWIEEGVKALSTCDLVGGDVVVTASDERRMSAVEAFESVFAFRQRLYVQRKKFSVTANLFATRAAAEAIGPFVNGVSEDVDWCRRAQALGFRLAFNAKSIISHPARRDWRSLILKWERLTTERWNGFEGRTPASRLKWAGLAVATALSAAPHLATVLTTTRLQRFEDRMAAASVLTRIRFWRARRMLALLRISGGPS
jgi:glycosyltransferase involved in cell wall biosynthesis